MILTEMDAIPISVDQWLSTTQDQASPQRKRQLIDVEDTLTRKRRRFIDPPKRWRERSWSENDTTLLSELPRLPSNQLRRRLVGSRSPSETLELEKTELMDPPPTPSASGSLGQRTASQASLKSVQTNSSSRDSKDATKSARYRRAVLMRNGVLFKHDLVPLPPSVEQHCHKHVLERKAETRSMSLAEAESLSYRLFEVEDKEEQFILEELEHPGPFPPFRVQNNSYKDIMNCTKGRSFSTKALPSSGALFHPAIVQPRPDFAFGYIEDKAFTSDQAGVVARSNIYQTADNNICPFLIIEGKSPAQGTNIWQASNQCAGGGSACVKVARALYKEQDPPAENGLQETDCVAYTLAVDSSEARLYVHWFEAPETYYLQCVAKYWIQEPKDLIRLQIHLQNIVDWGMGPRFVKVKNTVDNIVNERAQTRKANNKPEKQDAGQKRKLADEEVEE